MQVSRLKWIYFRIRDNTKLAKSLGYTLILFTRNHNFQVLTQEQKFSYSPTRSCNTPESVKYENKNFYTKVKGEQSPLTSWNIKSANFDLSMTLLKDHLVLKERWELILWISFISSESAETCHKLFPWQSLQKMINGHIWKKRMLFYKIDKKHRKETSKKNT